MHMAALPFAWWAYFLFHFSNFIFEILEFVAGSISVTAIQFATHIRVEAVQIASGIGPVAVNSTPGIRPPAIGIATSIRPVAVLNAVLCVIDNSLVVVILA